MAAKGTAAPRTWVYYATQECCPWLDPDFEYFRIRDPTREELLVCQRGIREEDHLRELAKWDTTKGYGTMFHAPFPPPPTGHFIRMPHYLARTFFNKTIAVYAPRIGSATLPVLTYLYCKWLRPFKNHIDCNEFIAKIIDIDLGQSRQALSQPDAVDGSLDALFSVIGDIVRIHRHTVQDVITQYSVDATMRRITPLFRSFIMVIKEVPRGVHEDFVHMQVYLVLTGETEGLSAPISLESLHTKGRALSSGGGANRPHLDMVLTTLEAAVDFVQELEKREESAFGIIPDPNVRRRVDRGGPSLLRTHGWTGELPLEPTHQLVDTSRWPEWTGFGKLMYLKLQFREDPGQTTSRKRIMQLYDPANCDSDVSIETPSSPEEGVKDEADEK